MRRRLILGLVGAAGAVAVAGLITLRTGSVEKPFDIKVGQDRCRRCNMIISRLEFAAGILLTEASDWYYYDDLGCFIMDYLVFERGGKSVKDIKAVDFRSKKPIDPRTALYVSADPKVLWTPMSYGFVALEKVDDAREVAMEYSGDVIPFDGLLEWGRKRV